MNRITLQGKLCEVGAESLMKEMLEADKCYMLDCDTEIFVWMGRSSLIAGRRISISATEVNVKLLIREHMGPNSYHDS